jgi:uncharacterized membrane protein YqjE
VNQDRTQFEPGDQQGYGALLTGLLKDLQDLVRGEVRLAKAELRDDVKSVTSAAGMLGAAAILSLVGLTILMIGVAVLITEWVDEDWQAFGLVGLALLLLAAGLGLLAKNRLSAAQLAPEQSIESLKEDKEWVSQQVRSLKN